ncbi:MAG: M15 family metallopeptidase [Methylocystis sp.]|uniref:M15 family metallopeptidase n=1 Tax=Methylocystis sp. TaxID=1911079 RepID=UPI003DA2D995
MPMTRRRRRLTLQAAGLAALLTALSPATAQTPRARFGAIPDDVWQRMQGRSWRPDLPCARREDLALMQIPYRDFDGATRSGELIVARGVAPQVAAIFDEIYDSGRFRIYQMRLIDDFGGSDDASIAANNTSGFNCRTTDHGGLSKHALGLAIDINPVQNPYREGAVTAPEAGRAYDEPHERHSQTTGIILEGDVVTRAFARRGWSWGGRWTHTVDYQHFSKGGH